MKRFLQTLLFALFQVILLSALFCSPLHAQDAEITRKWTIQNSDMVSISASGVHIENRASDKESAGATASLALPSDRPWRVTFDVKFGPNLDGAMSVHLLHDATDVCWMGSDSYYKAMSGFVGKSDMAFTQPWDTNWHTICFAGDGHQVVISCDGILSDATTNSGVPDKLVLASTELEVTFRNLHVQNLPLPKVRTVPGQSIPSTDSSSVKVVANREPTVADFQNEPLPRLVEDYNDTLTRIQEADNAFHNDGTATSGYLDLMGKASTQQDFASYQKSENSCELQEGKDVAAQKSETRRALVMQKAMKLNPQFSGKYHETRLCLPSSEVFTDLPPEAINLRFVEKRSTEEQ